MANESSQDDYVPALRYRWLTPFYDAIVGTTTRERTFKYALISQANIRSNQRVLDLACGTGTLSIWIKSAHPQAEIVGIDGDPEMLSFATNKATSAGVSIEFRTAMSYDLPYPDASFDRVVSSLFFHHLTWDNKIKTAREVCRVLKPGGQFHVADWGKADNIVMRGLFLFVQLLDGFKNTQDNVTGKLVNVFEQAGMTDVRTHRTISTMFGTMALYSAARPE
ncbi:MAG: methyltransferase domain-containing protein [Woeseiaceae bacterium]